MSVRRLLAGTLAMCAPLVPITCIAASPAFADPLPTAHAAVGVGYPTPSTFHVCATGRDDTGGTGEWLFEIAGLRGDGTQIQHEEGAFGGSFSSCVSPDISTNGTQDGSFVACLSFTHMPPIDASGTQSTTVPELAAIACQVVDWTPQQNTNGFGM